MMKKTEGYITDTPKQPNITINNNENVINGHKYYPGDSVNDLKELEEANAVVTGDEIKQQNENL